jgi:hypothetical protein
VNSASIPDAISVRPRDLSGADIERVRQRFDSRVRKDPGPCWIWTGWTHAGYGRLDVWFPRRPPATRGRRLTLKAHHLAWFFEYGEWPTIHVLHSCDNPSCVRPDHLRQGTPADNARDKAERGRARTGNRKGEFNPAAKLTSGQVDEIRSRLGPGVVQRRIAEEFGVSYMTISRIATGRAWRQ